MARHSEIAHRLGLSNSVRVLSMSTGYLFDRQRKGISRAGEIVNTLFRVGKFWEGVGGYYAHVACMCAEVTCFYSARSMLSCINTAPRRVSRTRFHSVV